MLDGAARIKASFAIGLVENSVYKTISLTFLVCPTGLSEWTLHSIPINSRYSHIQIKERMSAGRSLESLFPEIQYKLVVCHCI